MSQAAKRRKAAFSEKLRKREELASHFECAAEILNQAGWINERIDTVRMCETVLRNYAKEIRRRDV